LTVVADEAHAVDVRPVWNLATLAFPPVIPDSECLVLAFPPWSSAR
jgi:hypothetical protein